MKFTLLLLSIATMLTGCETYNRQCWTPDGFSYTFAADHDGMKPAQHYFGLNWNLKPDTK